MRVYKYRSGPRDILHRDIRCLVNNQIYAAPVEKLNDLLEARFHMHGDSFRIGQLFNFASSRKQKEQIQDAEDRFIRELEQFIGNVKTWGVYSLSRSPVDELLWAYYADAHRGFCLEYELDELLEYALAGQTWISVDYQEEIPTIELADIASLDKAPKNLTKKLIGTKSKRWEHESEIRIVTGQTGLLEYDFRALKAIHFGARTSVSLQRLVMRLMAGRGLSYYQAKPTGGRYALHSAPLSDLYPRPQSYRKRIAPVEDGVPYINTELKPFRSLIFKAIEIVRRDPYCERVTDAYLSTRGTFEEPVFFVTYERSDGIPRNFFLSKGQIESWRED